MAPIAAGAIGALPVVGGFLVNVIMQTTHAPGWVVNLSPWTHLAAVPDIPPNWAATTIFLFIGAILTALGMYGYVQRYSATRIKDTASERQFADLGHVV